MIVCIYRDGQNKNTLCYTNGRCRHISIQSATTKFNEHPFTCSIDFTCGRTDKQYAHLSRCAVSTGRRTALTNYKVYYTYPFKSALSFKISAASKLGYRTSSSSMCNSNLQQTSTVQ